MTEEKKKRYTFDPSDIMILGAEAMKCINEFAPAVRKDFGKLEYLNILEQIGEAFKDFNPIDVASFRLGMYAVVIEQEHRRYEDLKLSAGMRFIV